VCDLTVIMLTQRIFERSRRLPAMLPTHCAEPLRTGTLLGRRRRTPLSRQCRIGLPSLAAGKRTTRVCCWRVTLVGMRAEWQLLETPR
jgi:hypothetical protein